MEYVPSDHMKSTEEMIRLLLQFTSNMLRLGNIPHYFIRTINLLKSTGFEKEETTSCCCNINNIVKIFKSSKSEEESRNGGCSLEINYGIKSSPTVTHFYKGLTQEMKVLHLPVRINYLD